MIKRHEKIISETYSNFLANQLTEIEWRCLFNTAYPAGYAEKTDWPKVITGPRPNPTDDEKTNHSFFHLLIDNHKDVTSKHSGLWKPLMLECMFRCGLPLTDYYIYRARLGLILKASKKTIHQPHVDWNLDESKNSYNIVYYVNQSDGDTYVFGNTKSSVWKKEETIRNEYKKNSLVCFDGDIWHCSSTPEHYDTRIVLNLNIFRGSFYSHNRES